MTQIVEYTDNVRLDDRPQRHRIGLIVLATDHTTEPDFHRILSPQGIGIYSTRIPFANPVTPETLAAMAGDITGAAQLILPNEDLEAIVYSCTSASVVIGDDLVRDAMTKGKPGAIPITPISAGFAGLRAIGARRITLLTPYTAETTAPMADCFEAAGFTLQNVTCLGLTDDRDMARLSPASIIQAAGAAIAPDSDAIFISCTALRAAGVIDQIEAAIGVPAVSSNYATAWAALRTCGINTAAAPGRLMQLPMQAAA
ncbi:ectoine utilization protein EutA [Paracoccus sp. 11-3]|uniref:Ectoine utilization protein EutA n=1 Tax=Paracoccus amoyensis TaxID=2760093 RepID=A0A926GHL8_9RHOB|nr:ectoine utilization protein EutA [Paracoccus amoyensis]MBC9247152.1 ectoine utilization protein EutA [Paracoccus amoyensis]